MGIFGDTINMSWTRAIPKGGDHNTFYWFYGKRYPIDEINLKHIKIVVSGYAHDSDTGDCFDPAKATGIWSRIVPPEIPNKETHARDAS
jgi:hypothetical protein